MTTLSYVLPGNRGVLAIGGADARTFLQGLISADVEKIAPGRAAYGAFLTPQGKFLHDFFIVAGRDGGLLLDGQRGRLGDLLRKLRIYKLRSDVTVEDASDRHRVAVLFGDGAPAALGLDEKPGAARPFAGGTVYVDPRLAAAGARALLPREEAGGALRDAGFAEGEGAEYERRRIDLGLPDGDRDLTVEKSVLLDYGFEELNGVDFDKGCFLGQEVTARTKYRGLVKKRLVPVDLDGPAPEPGAPVTLDGRVVGEMRTSAGDRGLAVLRLEAIVGASGALLVGTTRLTPRKPDWAVFQGQGSDHP